MQHAVLALQGEKTPEVVTGVHVSTSVEEEHLDVLLDAFEQMGAPEPRITNGNDRPEQPRGYSTGFTLVHGKQLRGVLGDNATTIFSSVELEEHMNLVERLEAVATSWMEANENFTADDGKPLVVNTRCGNYGDLPVHFILNTSILKPDKFDELVKALRDSGAPQPGISEPSPSGIPVIRGDDYFGAFMTDQILTYHFHIPAVQIFGNNEKEMMDMMTDDEVSEHRAVIQRMEDALAKWNLVNPPVDGDLPVEFATLDSFGIVRDVSIKSTRLDRATMESLAATLALEGVPDYRYGSTYQNPGRNFGRPSPPTKRVNGSSLGFNLIPYIYWNGEMQKNITREMRQEAQDKYTQATTMVVEWLKSHPELNEFHHGNTLVEPGIKMPLLPQNGRERAFQVEIWSNDDDYRRAVMAELEELLSAIDGFPEIWVSHNRWMGGY